MVSPLQHVVPLAVAAAFVFGCVESRVANLGGDDVGEFRSVDGTGNNLGAPTMGTANQPLMRRMGPDYADGYDMPSGSHRPSARQVSNAVLAQTDSRPNARGATDYLWAWGQFLDHDIDLTPAIEPAEPMPIDVPLGDPHFDPSQTGTETIGFNRSKYDHDGREVRQQLNAITAFIDASQVYGSDEVRARALRTLDGTGRLKVSAGDFLPFNEQGLPNDTPSGVAAETLFVAGDVRANEVTSLTAFHTLFVREHNRIAGSLGQLPSATGDEVYQTARALVGAQMQAITFNEFLPALLGPDAIPPYQGYQEAVDPSIMNAFSTAAYRVGHTMLSPSILRLDERLLPIPDGALSLREAFFNPAPILETGLAPIFRGLAAQRAQEIDAMLIDEVRNLLFGPPGAGGADLASLNIQRGRDHGLPSYARGCSEMGLGRVTSFSDIDADPQTLARLQSAYDTVQDIDLWVGGLAERHVPGTMVGPLFHSILVEQFTALRDGDRFWYQNMLSPELVAQVDADTLSVIIRRNTAAEQELPSNLFVVR